jgi:hypothetical protein
MRALDLVALVYISSSRDQQDEDWESNACE